jgi:hypothetical protein
MKSPDIDWKDAAVGRFQDGDTIRTDLFRFTEYTDSKGKLVSRMLYDHSDDPHENVNVSGSRKTSTLKFTSELHKRMGRSKQ